MLFQAHKVLNYNGVLSDMRSGTPITFFLPLVRTRGRINEKAIDSLEDVLIKIGLERNDGMTEISGIRRGEIVVTGVWGGGRGRRPIPANRFREIMGL
jgi:hypothetical protein